ncbi:MAG: hypothetical protein IE933_11010 [Sphingomonadales bacterium]|nr:hypothetical protein [Sphingomonadales bacterium]MBD3774540.1 hypothetical protein [Paracoccaceae bacterium]
MQRRMVKFLAACAGMAAFGGLASPAGASGDYGCYPDWTLDNQQLYCWASAAMAPGNDTRINLAYLLQDARGVTAGPSAYPEIDWWEGGFGHTFYDWDTFQRAYWKPEESDGDYSAYYGSRCSSLERGDEVFAAALDRAGPLSGDERERLIASRGILKANCEQVEPATFGEAATDPAQPPQFPAAFGTGIVRDFFEYARASNNFYAGNWDAARAGYAALADSKDPWVRETAGYMRARVDLNAAQAGAFDEWGYFDGPAKTDHALARQAGKALADYLAAYPKGLYSESARGLQRRALWLAGDRPALAKAYAAMLAKADIRDTAMIDLLNEVDNKALSLATGPGDLVDPLLIATWDLQQMRASRWEDEQPATISAEQLDAQAPLFKGHEDLFAFLQATHAYYIGKDYQRVMQLIPDAARQEHFTPLQFSRQMLRGMALAQRGDRNEAGFWLEMLGGAGATYQRPLVELGLALNYERNGKLDQVFAKDSPITDTTLRQILLEEVAPPAILRASVADTTRPQDERRLALRTLLWKDLSRGRYADFSRDRAWLEQFPDRTAPDSETNGYEPSPLDDFRQGRWSDGYACPAIGATAQALAANPADYKARLCLGDFYRLNGFDDFEGNFTHGPDSKGLGTSKDQFPGALTARSAIYSSIIADPRAPATEKAYALYRSVLCYAPSGNNSCGGAEVPESQRKAWHDQLKRQYPGSEWAKKLKYYW